MGHGVVTLRKAQARPAPLRAPARGGAAEGGPARPPADQRRRRPAGARERDRAGAARGLVAAWSASTPGPRGGLRRLLPKRLGAADRTGRVPRLGGRRAVRRPRARRCDCACPIPSSRSSTQLRSPTSWRRPRTARARRSSRRSATDDRELEADVFEELDDHHQREFLEERSDDQVAADARADGARRRGRLVGELDEERREALLDAAAASATAPRCVRCSDTTPPRRAA